MCTEPDREIRTDRTRCPVPSLPVLQLLAAAINSIVIVISAKPIFKLPFESIDEALAATPQWPKARNNKKGAPVIEPRQVTPTPLAEGGVQ